MERLNARNTWGVGAVLACLFLAGCGGSAAAGGTSTPPHATPTPTAHSVALTGCTAQTPPLGVPAADVTITQGGGLNSPPINLRTGQRLRIQLSASESWGLTLQDAGHTLVPQSGNGWLDASAHTCVWQFTGSGVGTATLLFTGRPVCPPGAMCPNIVIERDFTVAVAA